MKKFCSILPVLFFAFLSFNVNAQAKTGADYFVGKRNVLVKGTPNGDAKMTLIFSKKDNTISGTVQDSTGTEISKIDKSELTGNQLTVYFTASGYDVNLVMTKKDEDHTSGSLMGMFDADGDRVKETKK